MDDRFDPRIRRYREAYLHMARNTRYRPQAPSDGHGNIQLMPDDLHDPARLDEEATLYADKFASEEDTLQFWIGCSDFETNRAFIWTIEAARVLASGDLGNRTAIKLLEMALAEVKRASRDRKLRNV
jgi:hypothetical protein